MTDLRIEPTTIEHLAEIVKIEQTVFTTPWTEEMFRQEITGVFGSRSYVALVDGRVAGYEIAWFFEDEVHLVNIAVDIPFRDRGVGKRLLSHLIDLSLAMGKRVMTLEVRAGNESAQSLYRAFGFQTVGVRKGYYSDNREDAVIMSLDLRRGPRRRKPRGKG